MQNYGPMRITCIDAASADETLGRYTKSPGYALQTYVVQGNGTTSSGVITFEEASWGDNESVYTGTWSAITTVNASDVTGGAQKFVHISSTANAFTRPRISTAVGGGGTVSVFLHQEGN
jgi:hypothetical protein